MGEAPVPEEQLPSSDAERIDVTGDGGVVKQITREGDPAGDCPPKSSMCFVNYRCWVLTEDEEDETHRAKIHDTWERGEAAQLSAGRDSSLFERGVTLALSSMRKGETALVHCTHPYGYGSKGHFSFPHVPGYASLLYQVELLDWDSPDDSRERATMTYEERCEAAERRKIQGNALFKEGRLEEALAQYDAGLSFINEDFIIQLHGFHMAHAQRIRCPILLNQAAAYTRQGKLEEAVLACGEVLQVDRKSSKALFRRGRARLMLGQTDPAREDLEAAAKLEPGDRDIQAELRKLRKEEGGLKKAQREVFGGQFPRRRVIMGEVGGGVPVVGGGAAARGGAGGVLAGLLAAVMAWIRRIVTMLAARAPLRGEA